MTSRPLLIDDEPEAGDDIDSYTCEKL